jgi:hypothetical protein
LLSPLSMYAQFSPLPLFFSSLYVWVYKLTACFGPIGHHQVRLTTWFCTVGLSKATNRYSRGFSRSVLCSLTRIPLLLLLAVEFSLVPVSGSHEHVCIAEFSSLCLVALSL